ncbi:hypothetical protein LBMAG56_29220 [Verrucomicrobiota bacterium]|nr:hypothetical protein LBMAG56_29220 [Verrucomicrobiota bacterium]
MKTLLALALLLTLAAPARAQRLPSKSPPTVTTATWLAFTLDINADTISDLVLVDRATGSFRIGTVNAQSEFVWSEAADTGLTQIETGAAGHFLSASAWSLVLSSKAFNRGQPVPLDGSSLPPAVDLPSPEPQTVCGLDPASGGLTRLITGYRTPPGARPQLTGTQLEPGPETLWAIEPGANPRDATPLYGHPFITPAFGILTDDATGPGSRFQVFENPTHPATLVGEITGLAANTKFAAGSFRYDAAPISFNYRSTTVLFWQPSAPTLRTARVTDVDWNNNFALPALTVFSGPAYPLPRPIRHVYVLEELLTRLLVVWSDAAGGASLYDFSGTNAPVLLEAVNLNGLDLEAVLPSANGSTVFLGTRDGLPAYDRMSWNGTHYARIATGSIPLAPKTPLYANLLAFRGEPFVAAAATELQRRRVKDWTLAAALNAGSASVTALTDSGTTTGLRNSSVNPLAVPLNTTHTLSSQLDAASSIVLLANASTAVASLPRVVFSPAPGNYSGAPLEVLLKSVNAAAAGVLYYSINGGAWQTHYTYANSPAPPLKVTLASSGTVRAYAYNYSFGTDFPGQGPITTAAYTLGTLPPVQPQPLMDLNANGLSDAWENLTGLTNPAADSDGDGFLNLQEHNAGTDPFNAASRPPASAPPTNLAHVIPSAGTPLILRWDNLDTAVILEASDDLSLWTPVLQGIQQLATENAFPLPTSAFPRAFYRLRR